MKALQESKYRYMTMAMGRGTYTKYGQETIKRGNMDLFQLNEN